MTDGHAEDRSGASIAGAEGWGSDIAGIADPCGAGTAVVASSAESAERKKFALSVLQAVRPLLPPAMRCHCLDR